MILPRDTSSIDLLRHRIVQSSCRAVTPLVKQALLGSKLIDQIDLLRKINLINEFRPYGLIGVTGLAVMIFAYLTLWGATP